MSWIWAAEGESESDDGGPERAVDEARVGTEGVSESGGGRVRGMDRVRAAGWVVAGVVAVRLAPNAILHSFWAS